MGLKPIRHEPDSGSPDDVLRHYLGDLVYGANDGIVTTFVIISGATGAKLGLNVLIILGLINLVADGFSMGAASFLSIRTAAHVRGSERGIREPLMHGGATFLSFFVCGAIPLAVFLLPVARGYPFAVSCIVTGLVLFTLGAFRSLVTPRNWLKSGLEMFVVGAVAALVAFGAGVLLKSWVV